MFLMYIVGKFITYINLIWNNVSRIFLKSSCRTHGFLYIWSTPLEKNGSSFVYQIVVPVNPYVLTSPVWKR